MSKQDNDIASQLLVSIPKGMWVIRCHIRKLRQSDLSVPHFRILAHLNHHAATSSELAETQGVSLPAMSRMVDGLVKKGHLVRIQISKDRRHIHLGLSKKGQKQFEKIKNSTQTHLTEKIALLKSGEKKLLENSLPVLKKLFP